MPNITIDFLLDLVSAANTSRSAASSLAASRYSSTNIEEWRNTEAYSSALQYVNAAQTGGFLISRPYLIDKKVSLDMVAKKLGAFAGPVAFMVLAADARKIALALEGGIPESGPTPNQSAAIIAGIGSFLALGALAVPFFPIVAGASAALATIGIAASVLSAFPGASDVVVDFAYNLATKAPGALKDATLSLLRGDSLFGPSQASATLLELKNFNLVEQLANLAMVDADIQQFLLTGELEHTNTETPSLSRSIDFWKYRAAFMMADMGFSQALPLEYQNVNFLESDSIGFIKATGLSRVVFVDQSDKDTNIEYGSGLNDKIYGDDSSNNLRGNSGNDELSGFGGDDVLEGGAGRDTLVGGKGSDWLGYDIEDGIVVGSNEELVSDGNVYDGGTGNDQIFGSINADTIILREGDGSDIIRGNGGQDVLQFATSQAAQVVRSGKDLVVFVGPDKAIFKDWYADSEADASRLHELQLGYFTDDGMFVVRETVSGQTLQDQGLRKVGTGTIRGDLDHYRETLIGGDGVDHVYSSLSHDGIQGGDVLVGGKGDDFLYGEVGADQVRISAGDGKDIFDTKGGADVVEFHGGLNINNPNTLIDRVMADLRITFEDGTTLTIKDWDDKGSLMGFRNGSDGVVIGYSEMSLRVKRFFGDGTDNYYTVSTPTSQKVYGSGGNDTLMGSAADDLLDGGTGNDVLFGGAGMDQLWGQGDNDRLYGGADDDKLYGNDGEDILWGEGGDDLLVGGDKDDQLYGGIGRDTLWGGTGADTLHGNDENDWLYGEAGNDVIKGGAGSNVMTGGTGNDEFFAEGIRDEMWGGGDFDKYFLTPTGANTQKLIFEDAQGGVVDLRAYAQAGIAISLLRSSADQLILTTSQGETIAVNGWSNQTTALDTGNHTWTYAQVQDRLAEQYGYTYDNVYRAGQFTNVVSSLSNSFQNAVSFYGASAVQSVFGDGMANLTLTGTSYNGAAVYRWGWKAGTLSSDAMSQGASYSGDTLTLFEAGRTRSSATLSIPEGLSDPHPVDRVDMWYDFWNDPVNGWSFAVVDAYSAEATTATQNADGTITPSAEYNKVVNVHDPATWGLVHGARNSFQLLGAN